MSSTIQEITEKLPNGYEVEKEMGELIPGCSVVEHKNQSGLYLVTAQPESDNIIEENEVGVIHITNRRALKSAENGFAQEIFSLDNIEQVADLTSNAFRNA